jgi:RHS repeat-associated protein
MLLSILVLFSAPAFAQMTSGGSVTGTIPGPPCSPCYVTQTFTATAGEAFFLHSSGNYVVNINVLRPDGTSMGISSHRFASVANQTGTYTVRLTGPGTVPVNYTLYYVRGNSTVSDGALNSGTAASTTMPVNGLKSYTITGTTGQGFYMRIEAGFSSYVTILKPDGSNWTWQSNGFSSGPSYAMPASGTYTVIVTGNLPGVSGDMKVHYVKGGGAVSNGKMDSGWNYDATMAANGLVSFQFEGVSGKAVMMRTSATYNPYIVIFKPDGTYWTNGATAVAGNLPAASGTYTVIIVGANTVQTGPVALYYVHGAETTSHGSLLSGQTRGSTLNANGLDSYTFEGTASTGLTLASTGSSYTRYIEILKPDGTYWSWWTNSGSTTFPAGQTGTYIITVHPQYYNQSGDYTITATAASPPAVPASTASKYPVNSCTVPPTAGSEKAKAFKWPVQKTPRTSSPNSVNGSMVAVGNPINFDIGFKVQVETDYDADGLLFQRTYRSDSSWTDNTVGTFWRHNFARTLSVAGSNASITDGSGATTAYTLVSSVWVPTDPSTTSKLETVTGGYKYTLHDGTVEKYDSTPKLTRIEYLGGTALNLAYNGSNQLTSVTNESGRSLSMTYSSGRVATLVTPDGTFSYSYTGTNLTTVTRPDTKTNVYHYENGSYPSGLTGITDAKGVRYATFAYGAGGKATSTQHAGGVDNYSVAYGTNDSTTTNPLSKDTVYRFLNYQGVRRGVQVDGVASTNCPAANKYYNYDKWGRLIGKTDWQNVITRYAYDSRSNVTVIAEAVSSGFQRVTYISWDATFNLPDVVREPGLTTDFDYDTYGRIVSMTETDTATSVTRITTYTYHSNGTDGSGNTILGRLDQIDGPRTDVSDITSFDYDGNYNLTKITNALGQETDITARDAAGRPTTIEDANNTETDLAYDTNGWLDTATRAPGTGLQAVYDFDYDFNGNLVKVTLPNGVFVEYSYDNAQRLTGIEDSLGNTVAYTLNNAGNATQVDVSNTTPTVTYTHDQTFDELMRLLTSVGAASQTATYAYDKNSNLTSYTDPNTNVTSYTYDPRQRLKTSTNALSGVTTLGYTGLDDVNSVTDQRNHSTTYTYNAFGDVVGEVSPDRGTLSYVVDKAGNVTQRTDARSVVTNFTYDALNRPLTVAYPADSSLNATLTYDASSGCGTAYKGHLCTVADATGTTTYVYDILGRVTSASENRGGGLTLATSYTYDLAGNIATITLPSGRVVTYTRNANGLVSNVAAPVNGSSVNLASSITYLPFGPLNALTYGNSLTLSATFDTDYNPTNRTISGGIANWTYTTDDNGNVTQAGATTYGYDALNRVNAENAGATTSYTYDATSNRLTKVQGGTTTTTVPSANNKISAVGGTSYTYDAGGNITAIGTNGYVWSAAALMKEYTISSVSTATYTYNAFNQRTKKVTGGVTTHYVYGAGGLLYGEYTTAGALVREYVSLNGAPLAQVTAGSPETVAYLHTDHLGTPRFATNSAGTQVWSWNNDAFGVSTPSGATTVNLRMPGQYYDAESGLFYNWNRYYNPAIGRYISSDPIGLAGGLNTFGYVGQNPVMNIDPTGEQAQVLVWGGCALILGVGIAIHEQIEQCQKNPNSICNKSDSAAPKMTPVPPITTTKDPDNDPECKKLNAEVQEAKDLVGWLGGSCSEGMSPDELQTRYDAWVSEGNARAKRDEKCWGGGNSGHQQAQAAAWAAAGVCSGLMK